MYLTAVKRLGNVLSGWDGYGIWREVRVPHTTADRVGQELCYVKSVVVTEGVDF